MSKSLIAFIGALIVLLAVQTWRVHALNQQVSEVTLATRALEPQLERTGTELERTEARKEYAPSDATSLDSSAKRPGAATPLSVSGKSITLEPQTVESKQPETLAAKKKSPKTAGDPNASQSDLPPKLRKSISQAAKAFTDGDYETALQLLEDAVQEFPQEAQAYASLAKMYNDLGMIDEAIKAYQDWTTARPNDAKAFLGAAGLYESLGMNAEALENLAQYERLKEGSPDSYAAAASMYRRLGMPQQELDALTNWVDAAPTAPQAYRALGEYYRRNGDPAAALAQYQQAATLAPGNVTVHSSMAAAYLQLGQIENAQVELQTAISLHPGDTNLQMRLADVYRRGGDLGSAIATYQGVIQQEPNSALALRASQQIARLQRQLSAQAPKTG